MAATELLSEGEMVDGNTPSLSDIDSDDSINGSSAPVKRISVKDRLGSYTDRLVEHEARRRKRYQIPSRSDEDDNVDDRDSRRRIRHRHDRRRSRERTGRERSPKRHSSPQRHSEQGSRRHRSRRERSRSAHDDSRHHERRDLHSDRRPAKSDRHRHRRPSPQAAERHSYSARRGQQDRQINLTDSDRKAKNSSADHARRDRRKREQRSDDVDPIRSTSPNRHAKKEKDISDADGQSDEEIESDNIQPAAINAGVSMAPSGMLLQDTNVVNGVVVKYSECEDARLPKIKWRLYVFKGEQELPILYIHRQSAFLLGRDRKVAEIPLDHPSCSKQHAVIQHRLIKGQNRPYIMDLESANGTFLNNVKIEPRRYVELQEKDVLKFGFSSREYVMLSEMSAATEATTDGSDL